MAVRARASSESNTGLLCLTRPQAEEAGIAPVNYCNNLLSDGATGHRRDRHRPPVLAGDRACDLATLLSCHYDHEQIRNLLRGRL